MYCNKCGKELKKDALFCGECGSKTQISNTVANDMLYPNDGNKRKKWIIFLIIFTIIILIILTTFIVCKLLFNGSDSKKKEKTPYCEEGTLIDGKCEILLTKEATYSCEDGYNLEDNTCVKIEKVDAKSSKTCNSGYTLSGNTCISTQSYTKETKQECRIPAEYEKYKDYDAKVKVVNGECQYSQCSKYDHGECVAGFMIPVPFTTISTCPSGTSEINGLCKKTANPTITYSCSEGTLEGTKCNVTVKSDIIISCEDGYDFNEETKLCELYDIVDPKEK